MRPGNVLHFSYALERSNRCTCTQISITIGGFVLPLPPSFLVPLSLAPCRWSMKRLITFRRNILRRKYDERGLDSISTDVGVVGVVITSRNITPIVLRLSCGNTRGVAVPGPRNRECCILETLAPAVFGSVDC